MNNEKLSENIASTMHSIWSHWMRYLFSVSIKNEDGTYTIPVGKVDRWQRQLETPYELLTDEEKQSDREQAIKIMNIFRIR